MPIDQETLNLLRTALLATATVLLIAKICRECGAEGLRRRLRLLETELFELGRNRHVGFPRSRIHRTQQRHSEH